MRELLEDAVLVYRQEADSLLPIVSVTAVLSLILLVFSAVSVTLALVVIPLFVILYLASFSFCVQWAGTFSTSRTRGRGHKPWLELVVRIPAIARAAAPGCMLAVLIAGSAVIAGDAGFWYLSIAVGVLGLAAGSQWLVKHAYDSALVIVFDAGASDAIEAGARLTADSPEWNARLLTLMFSPLFAAGAFCVLLGWLLAPLAGAAIFVLSLSAWLPFAALVLTNACQRLMDEQGALERLAAGPALP